jgi:hypothetical protein
VEGEHNHFPSPRAPIPQLMELMADAVEAGKVRAAGVSNYSAEQMRTAHAALARRGIPLASNQVEYSLLHRQPEVKGILEACRELGITLIAYQPLASGALTGKYGAGTRPRGLRRWLPHFRRKGLEALEPPVEKDHRIAGRQTTLQRAPIVPVHDPCIASKELLDGLVPLRCRCLNPAGSPVECVEVNQCQTDTPGEPGRKGGLACAP